MATRSQPTQPKPRRRWATYAWALLLITLVMSVIIVCGALWFVGNDPTQKAVALIERHGGEVRVESDTPEWIRSWLGDNYRGRIVTFRFDHSNEDPNGPLPIDDETLALICRNTPHVRDITLGNTHVTDDGLVALSTLASLEQLQLWENQIQGHGFGHLTKLPHLEHLSLGKREVNGIEHLPRLTALEALDVAVAEDAKLDSIGKIATIQPSLMELYVRDGSIDAKVVEGLVACRSLNILWLQGTKINDDQLAALAQCTPLEHLRIMHADITGAGFAEWPSNHRLRGLYLTGTNIDDEGLQAISQLSQLEKLELNGTDITGNGLVSLQGHENLAYLWLGNTCVDDASVKHLTQIPNLADLDLQLSLVSDASVATLASLPTLEELHLDNVRFTAAGAEAIRTLNPKLTVHYYPGTVYFDD